MLKTKSVKKFVIPMVAGAALGVSMFHSGSANAGALAVSILEVNAFKLMDVTVPGSPVQVSIDDVALTGDNTGEVSTSLGGTTIGSGAVTGSAASPTGLEIPQVCLNASGAPCGVLPFVNNSFSGFGVGTIPPTSSYSISDMNLAGSALDTTSVGGGTTGAFARTRADVSLVETGNGTSTSDTGASVNFEFTALVDADVRFEFDYIRHVIAHLSGDGTGLAQHGTAWSLTLFDITDGSFEILYAPTELQLPIGSVSVSGDPDVNFLTMGSLFSPTGRLTMGNMYQLSINHQTRADAMFEISEPGMIAIFALAAIAAGAAARRQRKAA